MKKLVLVLMLSALLPKITLAQNHTSISNNMVEIPIYNSCGENKEPPIPAFFKDLNTLTKRELDGYKKLLNIKDKKLDLIKSNLLLVASGEKRDSVGVACDSAWEKSRIVFFNKNIELFASYAKKAGRPVEGDKVELRGVTPLTVLRQYPIFDECKTIDRNRYTCYMLVYVRKDELDERMQKIYNE